MSTRTKKRSRSPRKDKRAEGLRGSLRFSRVNVITLLTGVVTVAAGYLFLAGGSTVAAPLLLVLGYVVLIPMGIVR